MVHCTQWREWEEDNGYALPNCCLTGDVSFPGSDSDEDDDIMPHTTADWCKGTELT